MQYSPCSRSCSSSSAASRTSYPNRTGDSHQWCTHEVLAKSQGQRKRPRWARGRRRCQALNKVTYGISKSHSLDSLMDEFLGVLWWVSQSICSNSRVTISEATASIEGNGGVEKVYPSTLTSKRAQQKSSQGSVALSCGLAQVQRTVKCFPMHF